MDIGATLRDARERRGLSIESLARITRIKVDLLRALECNAFEKLPRGIFLRGFLRSYAREVGLDPEAIVRDYVAEHEAIPAPAAQSQPPPRERVWEGQPRTFMFDPAWLRPRATVQWFAIGAIVAGFAIYSFGVPRSSARGNGSPRAVVPAGQASANAQASAPRQSPAAPAPVATAGSAMQLDIAPTGPCWISATAGGQRLAHGLLQSGDHRTLTVHDAVVLRVGDPGTFIYTINGAPGRPLGRSAEPVTVTIAPHNLRDFVAQRPRE